MRHQKKRHRLGRSSTHRKATLAALSNALIQHKRITTTQSKAKALRVYVEPLISRAKEDNTHNRRQVFRYLQNKDSVHELFGEIAEKVGDRPGGYTRVVKLGERHGDGAPMAVIELVDYNDVKPEGAGGGRKKTRRSRRRRSSKAAETVAGVATAAAEKTEDAVEKTEDVVEEVGEAVGEAAQAVEETLEETVDEVKGAVEDLVEETTEAEEDQPGSGESAAQADVDEPEAADADEADDEKNKGGTTKDKDE